jgi:hypothetical protein
MGRGRKRKIRSAAPAIPAAVDTLQAVNDDGDGRNSTEHDAAVQEDVYLKERAVMLDLIRANADQHDKAILQLTAATLGVSVTFIAQVAKSPLSCSWWLFGTGWTLLFLSLFAMLTSFHTGQRACHEQLHGWDALYRDGTPQPECNSWSTATTWLSRGSCALFLLGVLMILIFSWINLPS